MISLPSMPDNLQVQKNAGSNQPATNNEESLWRLKISDHQSGGDYTGSSTFPDRPGEPDCLYYLRTGLCGYGSNCRFNHPTHISSNGHKNGELPERVGQPDCEYFLKTGTCKYGSSCKYHHPRDRRGAEPVIFNMLGLPMRQEEKPCPYYMRTGSCKFGVACKFHHPQPASPGTLLPLGGPGSLGSSGSTVVTTSGLPYLWPLPRGPYNPTLQAQGQQAYMPILFSPSQPVVPTQGWNAYVEKQKLLIDGIQGNTSHVASPTIFASNLVYDSRNAANIGSGGHVMLLPPSPTLPERPDQPECRNFITTGTCKYGSDCKYHHPKERILQSTINPPWLPLRPGQAVCSYYSIYGLCKYGPSCKYDHPYLAHPYNYSFSVPTLSMSMLDSSNSIYPTNISTETSPTQALSESPDWVVQKSDAVCSEHEKPGAEGLPEEPDSAPLLSVSGPATSESLQDDSG